ncbi:MAG: tetratricopeptide repeat protein [Comamonas sp.]|nr:tetratricopeptide repeat protein [Comamonas sp.]
MALGITLLACVPAWAQPTPAPAAFAQRTPLAQFTDSSNSGTGSNTPSQHSTCPPEQAPILPTDPSHPPSACEAQMLQALHTQVQEHVRQGQWLQAELLLERILLLRPNDAQAILRLAQVLASQERWGSARALLRALQQDERTSAAQQQVLEHLLQSGMASLSTHPHSLAPAASPSASSPYGGNYLAQTDSPSPADSRSTELSIGLGYSRNPLMRPSARQLELTLPQGNITLGLQERPSAATSGYMHLYRRWASGLELMASIQPTDHPSAHSSTRFALAGPLATNLSTKGHWRWSLGTQRSIDNSQRHIASLHWTIPPAASGAEAGSTTAASALYTFSLLQDHPGKRKALLLRAYTGLGPWLTPLLGPLGQPGLLHASTWLEYEHRPGSSTSGQQPSALRGAWQMHWQPYPQSPWTVQAWLQAQNDVQGYSPLLAHGRKRRLLTSYLAWQYQWPQAWAGGQWSTSLYHSRRWSNLPLFAWNDYGISLGWQKAW